MPQTTDIGVRLREVRKRRGLSQRELAAAAGVSISLIRKLEQGQVTDTRMETARRLAVPLGVPTTQLLSRDAEPADTPTANQWEPVRRALAAPLPTPGGDAPTIASITETMRIARVLRENGRFAELATVLPALLSDSDTLVGTGAAARRVRVQALQLTAWLLTQTCQYDAANMALERALADATDLLDSAATINAQCWLLLRQGRLEQTRELAIRWADEIEPRWSRANPAELYAWGWMMIRISAAAVRDGQESEASDALRMAHSAAVMLGREYASKADYPRTFGPMKVARQRAEHAAVADRPDRVLRLAATLPKGPPTNTTRRYLLDVADAHAKTRNPGQAMSILREIQAVSPEWLLTQRYARDIVSRLIGKRRTLTPEMRALADAVGVPL